MTGDRCQPGLRSPASRAGRTPDAPPATDTSGQDPEQNNETQTAPQISNEARSGLPPGALLGDYRIVREIGRGGMGMVYEAVQLSLGRSVALKVLSPRAGISASQLQRFQREAEASSRQSHAGIVTVYTVGTQAGVHFIAQELVPGERTFADWLQEMRSARCRPKGQYRVIAERFARVADALQHAHEQGVVHRDIKPSNILLGPDDAPKVTDFGLAKIESALALTRTGMFEGTPYYVAPEQVTHGAARSDPRSDVYALGVTLYEALTLSQPFDGESVLEVLRKVTRGSVPAVRHVNPEVPIDLAVICQKALALDPGDRYASMQDFADDLRCWLDGRSIAARPVGAWGRGLRWCRRHRTVALASAGLLLGLLAWMGITATHRYQESQTYARLLEEAEEAAALSSWDVAIERVVHALALRPDDGRAIDRHQRYLQQKELGAVRRERDEKEAALRRSESLRLAVVSDQTLETHPTLALLLALAAAEREENLASRTALATAWSQCHELLTLVYRPFPFLKEVQHVNRGHFRRIAFTLDGQRLFTVTVDNLPSLWDLAAGGARTILGTALGGGPRYSVGAGAVDPGGRYLAIRPPRGPLQIYTARDGAFLFALTEPERPNIFCYSPDGSLLAVGSYDQSAYLFDSADGVLLQTLSGHRQGASNPTFNRDGTLLGTTSASDSTVCIWDVATGTLLHRLRGHAGEVRAVAFTPDDQAILTAGDDRYLRIWSTHSGEQIKAIPVPGDALICVDAIALSPDGTRFSASWGDPNVRIWEYPSGQEVLQLRGHEGIVRSIEFSPDGRSIATAAFDRTARIWDARTGEERVVLRGHEDFIHAATFDPDGRHLATISEDGTARLWSVDPPGTGMIAAPHRSMPLTFTERDARSPDGEARVIISNFDRARLVTTSAGRTRRFDLSPDLEIFGARFGAHGQLVVTGAKRGGEGIATLWDVQTGEVRCEVRMRGGVKGALPLLPQRRLLTSSTIGTVRAWDMDSGELLTVYDGHDRWATCCAYSADGELFATGSYDHTARIWDAASGDEKLVLDRHEGSVEHVLFDPSGRYLLTASIDRTVRLWDAATGEELISMAATEPARIDTLAFSRDGAFILLQTQAGMRRVWPVDPVETARRSRPRELTPEEQRAFSVWAPGEEDALALVERLFEEHLLSRDVQAHLRADASLPADVREAALRFAALQADNAGMLSMAAGELKRRAEGDSTKLARSQRFYAAVKRLRESSAP